MYAVAHRVEGGWYSLLRPPTAQQSIQVIEVQAWPEVQGIHRPEV